jgi:hypothetical protein
MSYTLHAMKLLEIREIEQNLTSRFKEAPFDLTGIRMEPSVLHVQDVIAIERRFRVKLPESFKNLILKYEFGTFALGGIFFGNVRRYDDFLLKMNLTPEHPWWGKGERPSNWLLVAGTDGYVVLLEVDTGTLSAYLRDESWEQSQQIAADFELFIRASGTAFLTQDISDTQMFAIALIKEAGGSEASNFWLNRIKGYS